METWKIEVPAEEEGGKRRKSRYQRKGATFEGIGIGVLAPRVGYGTPLRPLWASFACEEGAIRPFIANILIGRKVTRSGSGHDLEFMRSLGYEVRIQRMQDGLASAILFQPTYFAVNPGPVDDSGGRVEYIILPDDGLTARVGLPPADVHMALAVARNVPPEGLTRTYACPELDATFVALAALSAAYLDHRTRCPLLADLGFYTYLYKRMWERGVAVPAGDDERGANRTVWTGQKGLGYGVPVVVNATTEEIETLIAETVAEYIPRE